MQRLYARHGLLATHRYDATHTIPDFYLLPAFLYFALMRKIKGPTAFHFEFRRNAPTYNYIALPPSRTRVEYILKGVDSG